MTKQIAILPGDGIGPEIIAQAVKVLDKLIEGGLDVRYEYAPLGGAAYDAHGKPYPDVTRDLCRAADAVLLGAVGDSNMTILSARCVLNVACWRFGRIWACLPICALQFCTLNLPMPQHSSLRWYRGLIF